MSTAAAHHEECWCTPYHPEWNSACCDIMRCIGRGCNCRCFISMQGLLEQFLVSLNFKYSFWWWHWMFCCPSAFRKVVKYADISRFNLAVCSWNLMVLMFKDMIFEWSEWMALKVRCIFHWQVWNQTSNGGWRGWSWVRRRAWDSFFPFLFVMLEILAYQTSQ